MYYTKEFLEEIMSLTIKDGELTLWISKVHGLTIDKDLSDEEISYFSESAEKSFEVEIKGQGEFYEEGEDEYEEEDREECAAAIVEILTPFGEYPVSIYGNKEHMAFMP